jgi:D-3-phosphoglycerate dehydrogenase
VVELALGEILVLARRVFDKATDLNQGIWNKSADGAFEVRGKKLGIVGYGNIGSQLSVLAEALGMDVSYFDIVEKLPLGNATKCASLKELLKRVDIVSVHVDGNPRNHSLFGHDEFRSMKDGALFLNLSRGFVVDMDALAQAVRSGKIGGAAVDVFPEEPSGNRGKFASPLAGLTNVILTPHIGGSTKEAQRNIAEFVTRFRSSTLETRLAALTSPVFSCQISGERTASSTSTVTSPESSRRSTPSWRNTESTSWANT